MNDLSALIAGMDGFSLLIGLVLGVIAGLVLAITSRLNTKRAVENLTAEMKNSFGSLSSEALHSNQQSLLNMAKQQLDSQTRQHGSELETKKQLIDQQLGQMSQTLKEVPSQLESSQSKVSQVLQQSTDELRTANQNFLSQIAQKSAAQTRQHIAELEAKKQLIDQQLEQMSETLKEVPSQLQSSETRVSQALEKSTQNLEESAKRHLTQLQEKAKTQTQQHSSELETKKELIDQRLNEMDSKLGRVEQLISEFETARESKLGALNDQLKSLTQTTTSLQKALADNRARGQWGERIAEDILRFMGMVEGVNYAKQTTSEIGTKPDFTFVLPNQLKLNMDSKFPLDNYLKYMEAESEGEKHQHTRDFLRNVENHVSAVTKREYINAETVDCVLIFIPNEQVYRFIHEHGNAVIDSALQRRVILCSPLTLYIVLAVIRQAAQNFNVEQKSQEVIKLLADIKFEWRKYAKEMDLLEKNFSIMHNRFRDINGVRTRKLGSAFDQVETMIVSSPADNGSPPLSPAD